MLIVLVLPGILFPPKKTANRRTGGHAPGNTSRAAYTTRTAPPPAPLTAVASPFVCPATRPSGVAAETVWVSSPRARFGFGTAGAQLLSAELLDYKSFAPGDAERPVQLVPADGPLLAHCLVVGGDTISLADWRFTPSVPALRVERDSVPLTLTAERRARRSPSPFPGPGAEPSVMSCMRGRSSTGGSPAWATTSTTRTRMGACSGR